MKKILLVSIVTILGLSLLAQNQNIEGIGIFKISKTTISIIKDLSEELNVSIKQANSSEDLYKAGRRGNPYILQISPNDQKDFLSPAHSTKCNDFTIYSISSYVISTFEFKEIYLTFYHDTLVKFQSKYPEKLGDALRVKFGKPTEESKEKEITCTYTYTGAETKHKEIDIKHIWKNENITAQVYFWQYYTSDCEKHFVSGFYVEDNIHIKLLDECEKRIKEQKEKSLNDDLKKKSDGL
ncbi:MAG: hypothetical protein ACOYM0_01345 [Bacteroidales bacterium]